MVQEFHVLRCFSCQTFQVQQVKKSKSWVCKVCGEKQSLMKEFGRGGAVDCRRHVQKLNALRGRLEETHPLGSQREQEDEEDEDEEEDQENTSQDVCRPVSRWSKYSDATPEAADEEEEEEEEEEEHVCTDTHRFSSRGTRKRKKVCGVTCPGPYDVCEEEESWSSASGFKTPDLPDRRFGSGSDDVIPCRRTNLPSFPAAGSRSTHTHTPGHTVKKAQHTPAAVDRTPSAPAQVSRWDRFLRVFPTRAEEEEEEDEAQCRGNTRMADPTEEEEEEDEAQCRGNTRMADPTEEEEEEDEAQWRGNTRMADPTEEEEEDDEAQCRGNTRMADPTEEEEEDEAQCRGNTRMADPTEEEEEDEAQWRGNTRMADPTEEEEEDDEAQCRGNTRMADPTEEEEEDEAQCRGNTRMADPTEEEEEDEAQCRGNTRMADPTEEEEEDEAQCRGNTRMADPTEEEEEEDEAQWRGNTRMADPTEEEEEEDEARRSPDENTCVGDMSADGRFSSHTHKPSGSEHTHTPKLSYNPLFLTDEDFDDTF